MKQLFMTVHGKEESMHEIYTAVFHTLGKCDHKISVSSRWIIAKKHKTGKIM
jgi:hypothetical protein